MRKIEFIAPVESMRGNLGTKQTLVYAPNNNRAFDSIEGQVNPALNYEPRLIGAKGKRNYFCVKTKSSVHLTQNSKAAMADFGGIGAVYAAIVRDKSSQTYIKINGIYQKGVDEGHIHMSFRKYLSRYIGYMIKNKLASYTFSDGIINVKIGNPWVFDIYEDNPNKVAINNEVLSKFWMTIALEISEEDRYSPITFKINNSIGVAFDGDDFTNVFYYGYNILNLSENENGVVMMGNDYLVNSNGDYVNSGDSISNGEQFRTTNVAPE